MDVGRVGADRTPTLTALTSSFLYCSALALSGVPSTLCPLKDRGVRIGLCEDYCVWLTDIETLPVDHCTSAGLRNRLAAIDRGGNRRAAAGNAAACWECILRLHSSSGKRG